jgi:hypothetical protein
VAVIKDPSLESMKFYYGLNIKSFDPRKYTYERGKVVDKAVTAIGSAKTSAELNTAVDTLKAADPAMYGRIKNTMHGQDILLNNNQKRMLDMLRKMPAP